MRAELRTTQPPLVFEVPDELIESIAEKVAAILEAHERPSEDGWLRGGQAIADYIGAPRSRVYALATTTPPRIPVHRDGSALVARRSALDLWLRDGGGRRP